MVHVDWRIEGDRLAMKVELPDGVEYLVRPGGRLAGFTLDLDVKIQNSF
jgi:hypothetical protein